MTLNAAEAEANPVYRLLSNLLDPEAAAAAELAALYQERWEIESALDELKTPLRGARIVLRSQDPGAGAPRVLWALDGALRAARADA